LFGVCDVAVCDGFSGNILLKSLEGMAQAVFKLFKEEFTRDFRSKLGAALLKPSFMRLKRKLDYSEYGGAPMMGLKGACIKAHGSSDARAIENAIYQAIRFVEQGVNERIIREIQWEAGNG
jgi:glycerol-3-phosphate acyltransferase PlsX